MLYLNFICRDSATGSLLTFPDTLTLALYSTVLHFSQCWDRIQIITRLVYTDISKGSISRHNDSASSHKDDDNLLPLPQELDSFLMVSVSCSDAKLTKSSLSYNESRINRRELDLEDDDVIAFCNDLLQKVGGGGGVNKDNTTNKEKSGDFKEQLPFYLKPMRSRSNSSVEDTLVVVQLWLPASISAKK